MTTQESLERQMLELRRLIYATSQRALGKEEEFNFALIAMSGSIFGAILMAIPLLIVAP